MLNHLNIIALVVFIVMISAFVCFQRKTKDLSQAPSRVLSIAAIILSISVWVLTFQWHLDSTTRVVGFPFTAAVFEFHDGMWVDYVGAITLPAMIANLVFWVLLFGLPLIGYRYIKRKPQQKDGEVPS